MYAKKLILLAVAGGLVAGCSYRLGDLTIASTKNVNVGDEYVRVETGVKGEDTKPIIVFIPTGHPSLEEAIDVALRKVDGDLMTNVVIYYKWYYIPYIYGEYTYEVSGDVWKKSTADLGDLQQEIKHSDKVYTLIEKNGQLSLVNGLVNE